jgi:hypothetical protein
VRNSSAATGVYTPYAQAISWGFTLGEMSTHSVLRINERGEWIEHGDLTIGGRPPQKLIDLTVRRA